MYLINAALPRIERDRITNVLPLTLGPHGSNMAEVVDAVGPIIYGLEQGVEFDLEGTGQMTFVCAFTMAFTGDMSQQQKSSGMLGPSAALSCRSCFASKHGRGDLDRDIVASGRFHFETPHTRTHMAGLPATQKKKYATANGLDTSEPPLQKMSPALDIILTRPSDPAHSEFQGLTQLLHLVLLESILTQPAKVEFQAQLKAFLFPPGWHRALSITSKATPFPSMAGGLLLRQSCSAYGFETSTSGHCS